MQVWAHSSLAAESFEKLVKFNFSEKATKICTIVLMVLTKNTIFGFDVY